MKGYVRDNNTSFNLTEVQQLAAEWIAALDPATSLSYLEHVRRNEDVFKKANNFVEEVEPKLDENDDSIDELDFDSDNNDDSF